jgi:hypothetical protein
MNAARTQTSDLLQALAKGACPICVLLKRFQTTLIENDPNADLQRLCNFHAWSFAKSAPGPTGAAVFRRALHAVQNRTKPNSDCDICDQIRAEEQLRVTEFAEQMKRPMFLSWMRQHGTLCLNHAELIKQNTPEKTSSTITDIVTRNINELTNELDIYLRQPDGNQGGGVLGRVAEFLVGQRGILSSGIPLAERRTNRKHRTLE